MSETNIPSEILETFPKKIYLQTTDEDECEPFIDNHEATWCTDRIHTSDVEYTRSDLVSKTIDEKNEEIDKLIKCLGGRRSQVAWKNAEIDSLEEIKRQQASTIAALQAEKEETKKDFYWQGVEISELKAENERLKRLIDGPPHLQKIWDDFMKENNL